jgi:activator of HSP90 ATPase
MQRAKIELKYTFSCSAKDLFAALTQPDYLQHWIADRVEFDRKTGLYTFWWGESQESARIVERLNNRYVKWGWEGESRAEGEFVIFKITIDPDDEYVDLYITDYCDEMEVKIVTREWEEQMQRLESLV